MLYKILRAIGIFLYKIFFRFEVVGKEKIPKKGKLIICANHKSNFDPVTLALATPRQINFMAKKELFENKILGKFIRSLGAFPIDRQSTDIKALKKSITILNEEKCLGIFPEGTRVKTKDRANLKKGIGYIGIKGNSNIITAEVIGNYKIFRKVKVEIKDLIQIENYKKYPKKEAIDVLANDIFESIYRKKELEG
ncbi:MAG: lysophospholipid acyltransferase family protein [Tissierellia bacterium]|nr:lysophospholipid acyltransferase family protein [Tissierellia bacterium]